MLNTSVKSLPELKTLYNQYKPLKNKTYVSNMFLMNAYYNFL